MKELTEVVATDLFLRKGAEQRLTRGHLWVYSNEVDTVRSPLSVFGAGDLVQVRNSQGKLMGSAYMEPQSLICARIYASDEQPLDKSTLTRALQVALEGRQLAFDQPFYRLVYGDSDNLPGLVVDRFGDYLVVQLNTSGIERYQALIVAALIDVIEPLGILLRADSRQRRELGLEDYIDVVYGKVPEQVELQENGVRFMAPIHTGQKTGWFYDHRMSRARLRAYVANKSVLDVYSYIGGWGIQAAVFGAAKVCCVDSSVQALAGVELNAELNGVADRVTTEQGSAAETMTRMKERGEQYDVVVLDPPAFIQRRKDIKKGLAAYRRINELGLHLLRQGGILIAGSCSMHLSRSDLMLALQGAAIRAGCRIQVIEQGAQGADHPIHPAIPETEYLKAVFVRRL